MIHDNSPPEEHVKRTIRRLNCRLLTNMKVVFNCMDKEKLIDENWIT